MEQNKVANEKQMACGIIILYIYCCRHTGLAIHTIKNINIVAVAVIKYIDLNSCMYR